MSQPSVTNIKLSLPPQAVEVVLAGLAELPVKVAGNLFAFIQATAREQLRAAAAPAAEPTEQTGDKPGEPEPAKADTTAEV